ncbi:unnamed protein product [Meloidogyne enterolobii]|uniref:EF-hand domain-containing protein n=2 Tax=Meloidogyne enterolobii TaxID=390850 RepID=A0A6V7TWP3_MELEN|nr:unnamed protein product [Meloidogyne enterolobii]CAD2192203.1 unnamed protein product [Meloidogyne enterolobii]
MPFTTTTPKTTINQNSANELLLVAGGISGGQQQQNLNSSRRQSANSRNRTATGGGTPFFSSLLMAQGSSGRATLFGGPFRVAKFASSSSAERTDDGGGNSAMRGGLITKLDKYTTEELKEYRQIFNMFDADRSGAIGIEELESAITNLGMDSKQIDVEMLMREADKRGNHQIDFDEFCEVMKTTSEKTQSWNEVIKECFNVFDRNESGLISKKDFDFVLRELGDIQNSRLIDELFIEYDVDGDGFIDFDEFSFLVRNYLTDEDV